MIAEYPWGRFYESAILETDRSKLAKHIQVAEREIATRMQELNSDPGSTEEERSALRDAMSGLTILRKELAQSVPEGGFGSNSPGNPRTEGNSGYCGQEQE